MCSPDTTSARHADALIDAQVGQFIRPDTSAALRIAAAPPMREHARSANRKLIRTGMS
jgi:hypothetical protein